MYLFRSFVFCFLTISVCICSLSVRIFINKWEHRILKAIASSGWVGFYWWRSTTKHRKSTMKHVKYLSCIQLYWKIGNHEEIFNIVINCGQKWQFLYPKYYIATKNLNRDIRASWEIKVYVFLGWLAKDQLIFLIRSPNCDSLRGLRNA